MGMLTRVPSGSIGLAQPPYLESKPFLLMIIRSGMGLAKLILPFQFG